jgi:hypothetical protein
LRIFNALGHITYRYRWLVVLAWGALLIAGAFFAPNVSDRLKGGFGSANSEAEQVQYIMIEEFGVSPNSLTIVFEGGGLLAENSQFQEAEDRALDEVRELEEVENVIGYSETNDYRFVSEDGGESYALVTSTRLTMMRRISWTRCERRSEPRSLRPTLPERRRCTWTSPRRATRTSVRQRSTPFPWRS